MRYVHLGLPFTTIISVPTMTAARDSATDFRRTRLVVDPLAFSVPCHGFNLLFSRFLNNEGPLPEKERYSHFCLLHADVVPLGPLWLDTLLDEMDECGADVIHAPVAIKDDRGATSTSVGPMGNEWGNHRKLTVKELQELPSPFGLMDVLKLWENRGPAVGLHMFGPVCLCPNTGCLVAKLGDWCRDFPGFEIHTRMVQRNGKSVAEFAPEDWRFGHWAAQRGVKVMGSTKVRTSHLGGCPFTTAVGWGQDKDEGFLKGE